jgi:hypothetical protein
MGQRAKNGNENAGGHRVGRVLTLSPTVLELQTVRLEGAKRPC